MKMFGKIAGYAGVLLAALAGFKFVAGYLKSVPALQTAAGKVPAIPTANNLANVGVGVGLFFIGSWLKRRR